MTYIVLTSNEEVIITTPEDEEQTVKEFFTEAGRKVEDYNREVISDVAIRVLPSLRVK